VTAPEFLEPDTVRFLHDEALRAHGGIPGIRDEGLLESALQRPRDRLNYGADAPDLFELATAYAFGISRNHAFHDGNKRTAWACCVLFLRLNGIRLRVDPRETVERMVDLARSAITEAEFAAWLRAVRHAWWAE